MSGRLIGKFTFPEGPITVHSGEELHTVAQYTFDKNGQLVAARLLEVEIVGKPKTKKVYNYDD